MHWISSSILKIFGKFNRIAERRSASFQNQASDDWPRTRKPLAEKKGDNAISE
jgi:hypothetical protein